jgi:hypothetical protein
MCAQELRILVDDEGNEDHFYLKKTNALTPFLKGICNVEELIGKALN